MRIDVRRSAVLREMINDWSLIVENWRQVDVTVDVKYAAV